MTCHGVNSGDRSEEWPVTMLTLVTGLISHDVQLVTGLISDQSRC